jgi:GNAT superfamily N-acetyltransferase
MTNAPPAHRCSVEESVALAQALGDTPEKAFAAQLLSRGLCHAYVLGDPAHPGATLVETFPGQFLGFGAEASALWELLQLTPEWTRVGVESRCADELAERIRHDGGDAQAQDVIFSVLPTPVRRFVHPDVRLLSVSDMALLQTSLGGAVGRAYGSPLALLMEGIVAAAVQDGQCIARAHTSCQSKRYADIAIVTRDDYQGQGLGTAAASLACEHAQRAGRTPIWSTTSGNHASRRIAQKLGFVDTSHMTYFSRERPPAASAPQT